MPRKTGKRKVKRKDLTYVNETWVPIPEQYTLTHDNKQPTAADVAGMSANAPRNDRFAVGHEIGHLFLEQTLTDADRARVQRILGKTGPWDRGTGLNGGYQSPSEIAADYYGAAATAFDPSTQGLGGYAQIDPKTLKRFKKYLDRLGRARGLRQYGSDGRADYGEF